MAEGYYREVARRVFAQELRDSNLASKDESDQYAPQYILTPTGAKKTASSLLAHLSKRKILGLVLNTGEEEFQIRQVISLSMPDSTIPMQLSSFLTANCQFL